MQGDSTLRTLTIAGLLCIVCSILVSGASVALKPFQEENKVLDVKKNLLVVAGLIKTSAEKNEITEAYSRVEAKVIDLDTGEYVDIDPDTYDQKTAAKSPGQNKRIKAENDVARIKIREKLSKVYFIRSGDQVTQIIFPVYGKGLWSTMYGFIALAPDTKTVLGIGFYEHGETPGLGGEIENTAWQKSWIGKKLYTDDFTVALDVIKGKVNPAAADARFQVDGLSGATLTSNGVEGMVKYWFGVDGFSLFLEKYRQNAGGNNE